MKYVSEPSKNIPIIGEYDICILGGSCSGTFAAVRAARLGMKVIIIEKYGCLGGVCTLSYMNCWHSIFDFDFNEQIIAGLTTEVLERLKRRNQLRICEKNFNMFRFNSEELKIELDLLAEEAGVDVLFHTMYCSSYVINNKLEGVFAENKDGRGVVLAKVFIDATGDGDLCRDLQVDSYLNKEGLMPPTPCFKLYKEKEYPVYISQLLREHGAEYGLADDWGWNIDIPGISRERMCAETHVLNNDCLNAQQKSNCEREGRKQIRAVVDLLRKYMPDRDDVQISGIGAEIGIREGLQYETAYFLKNDDVLGLGERFNDAILSSSYPMDIHHSNGNGLTMRYLNGAERISTRENTIMNVWKEYADGNYPKYWQAPYRMLLLKDYENVLLAGRMIYCESGAFSSIRVRINLNQIGEAAGIGAYLAVKNKCDVKKVDVEMLRLLLVQGGSIII